MTELGGRLASSGLPSARSVALALGEAGLGRTQPLRGALRLDVSITEDAMQQLGAVAQEGQRLLDLALSGQALAEQALGARGVRVIRSERGAPDRERLAQHRLRRRWRLVLYDAGEGGQRASESGVLRPEMLALQGQRALRRGPRSIVPPQRGE